jgi:AraC-like DNA-binding protein
MTDQPLCEIALCCGFADQSHFSTVYRRRIRSSPGSWRRQRRSEPVTHEEPMHAAQLSWGASQMVLRKKKQG